MSGHSLGKMTVQLLGAKGVTFSLSLLSSIVVARALGLEGLGAYSYALGLSALFALVPNMGISTVVTRAIARDHEASHPTVRAAFRAQMLLALAAVLLVVGFAALLPAHPVPFAYIAVAALQLGIGSLSWPYLAIIGGHSRFDRLARSEIASAMVALPLLLAAMLLSGSVESFLLAQLFASLLALCIARHYAAPFLPPHGPHRPLLPLFREAAGFGGSTVVMSLYGRIDILLLGQMAAVAAVGMFNAAGKPVTMALYVGLTVAGVLFPLMARTPHGEVPQAFARAVRAVGVLGPAMALAVAGMSHWILALLFGIEYAAADSTLAILIWTAAANWLYSPLSQALQAQGMERWWLLVLTLALLINLAGNLWAIPRWWADGAAVVRLTSDLFLLAAAALLVRQKLAIALPWAKIGKVLLAIALGIAMLRLAPVTGSLMATLGALAAYFAALLLLRVIHLTDIDRLAEWMAAAIPRLRRS